MGLASPWGREEEAHQEELGGGVGGCVSLGTLRGLGALCSCPRACLGRGAPRESWMGGLRGRWGPHQLAFGPGESQGKPAAGGGGAAMSGGRPFREAPGRGGAGCLGCLGALTTLAALLGRGPSGCVSGWVWAGGLRGRGSGGWGGVPPATRSSALLPVPLPPRWAWLPGSSGRVCRVASVL